MFICRILATHRPRLGFASKLCGTDACPYAILNSMSSLAFPSQVSLAALERSHVKPICFRQSSLSLESAPLYRKKVEKRQVKFARRLVGTGRFETGPREKPAVSGFQRGTRYRTKRINQVD